MTPAARRALAVVAVAALARLAVVAWASARFPPADDGKFYQVVAARIADGLGYTWLWPDGAVTYAAHYPIGYPGLVGGLYALFGPSPLVAMLLNAAVGVLGVWAVHALAESIAPPRPALACGLVAALHPGLVLYTPALMTEGVTAALFAVVAAVCVRCRERGAARPWPWLVGLGLLCGGLALLRPQALLFAPLAGLLALDPASSFQRARAALVVTAVSVAVCLPWTARNCARLERCVFVSANGGWNLYIGSAKGATGSWVAIDELGVPAECRTVYGEADKDHCFGRAGLRNVREEPGRFLALVPAKLGTTFDWIGAPGHYLHASNPSAFDADRKLALGVVEAVVERLVLLVALVGVGRGGAGRRALVKRVVIALALPWVFLRSAWVAHVLLVLAAALDGRELLRRPVVALAAGVVLVTAATHAVFFGAGRYGLVCALLLVALAAEAFRPPSTAGSAGF